MNVLASLIIWKQVAKRDIAGALQVDQGTVSRYLKIDDLQSEPLVKGRPPIIAHDVRIVKEVLNRATSTQSELARDAN
jgi:hypothetical protein